MENIMEFSFVEGTIQNLRVIEIDGEPWFVGVDVCKILEYLNPRDALLKHVDKEDKNTVSIRDGIRGNPNKTIINEAGLYSLIFSSKQKKAKEFKKWVTHEVLPSIRKTGKYEDTEGKFDKYCPVSFSRKQIFCQMGKNIKRMNKDVALVWYIYFKSFGEKIGRDFYSECKRIKKKPIVWLEENNLLEEFRIFCS